MRLTSTGCGCGCGAVGLDAVCGCDPDYPPALRALAAPPAVLYVAGVPGATSLARSRSRSLALGRRRRTGWMSRAGWGAVLPCPGSRSSAAWRSESTPPRTRARSRRAARTVAVLPASADRPYPPGKRALHRRIVADGAAVSEIGPGTDVWRWMFPARNRIIAALAAMTVVVEAGERSGALVTARLRARHRPPRGSRARSRDHATGGGAERTARHGRGHRARAAGRP